MFESQHDIAANDQRQRRGRTATRYPRLPIPRTLSHVSRRTRLGRRIAALTALYVEALGADALSPIKRLKVDAAAQLMALAENARGDFMRDGVGNLDKRRPAHAV